MEQILTIGHYQIILLIPIQTLTIYTEIHLEQVKMVEGEPVLIHILVVL